MRERKSLLVIQRKSAPCRGTGLCSFEVTACSKDRKKGSEVGRAREQEAGGP